LRALRSIGGISWFNAIDEGIKAPRLPFLRNKAQQNGLINLAWNLSLSKGTPGHSGALTASEKPVALLINGV